MQAPSRKLDRINTASSNQELPEPYESPKLILERTGNQKDMQGTR